MTITVIILAIVMPSILLFIFYFIGTISAYRTKTANINFLKAVTFPLFFNEIFSSNTCLHKNKNKLPNASNKKTSKKTKTKLFDKFGLGKSTAHIIKIKPSKHTPVIEALNVNKTFGDFEALKEINFKIMPGEKVGIVGGNGAGKTTLSEIIIGLNFPTSGIIKYGINFNKQPQENIGMQFQDSTYPSGLTVKNIIDFAKNIHKLNISPKEIKDLLKTFQMEDFYDRKTRSLSGGQRQKLNILLSVLHKPDLVILDELSTGLDISAREDIIRFTKTLLNNNKMSAILISHHEAELTAICDRIIVMDRGRIVTDEPMKAIIKNHKTLSAFMLMNINKGNKKAILDKKNKDIEDAKTKKTPRSVKRLNRRIEKGGDN